MVVLSLFDGISCGQIAFERCGIPVESYYASEIKKCAIQVTMKNYPNTIQIGDVTKVFYRNGILHTEKGDYEVPHIDFLIGGSPCQDFSSASILTPYKDKNVYGLEGSKSSLFYEYLRLLREVQPTYFLLENVKMKPEAEKELNSYMGVKGIHINSNLVSFQNRERIYWTNIPGVDVPEDKHINFQDFKDTDPDYCRQFKVKRTPSRERMWNNGVQGGIGNCPNITERERESKLFNKKTRQMPKFRFDCI